MDYKFASLEYKGYEVALELMSEIHQGQKRKFNGSEPYVLHPIRVANEVIKVGGGDNDVNIALLHDVVEDGGKDVIGLLRERGISEHVISRVQRLSKPSYVRSQGSYLAWVGNMDDISVVLVKLMDIRDNMVWRGKEEESEEWLRLRDKYQKAERILVDKLTKTALAHNMKER